MLKTNLSILAVVIGCLGVFTWVANAIPQLQSDVPEDLVLSDDVTPEELIAAGEELYNGGGGCTACHGLGERAPNLLTDHAGTGLIGERCANRVPGEDCKQYLHTSMVDPNAYLVEGFAPIMLDASRTLSSVQIWALVAYLQSLGGEVTVTGADFADDGGAVSAGGLAAAAPAAPVLGPTGPLDPEELLTRYTCATCHAISGPSPLGPSYEGMGSRLTADEIRTSILDPTASAAEGFEQMLGIMPPMFGNIPAAELEAIVQFIASQR
ncbi:MAG: cytochrome c [Gammaproteobacteria bacterium]|nr:cytochrome c [Gammaproteobacteria bacterium]MDE0259040.1 cytochrome c [Gammaproteobacteria bacterium]